MERHVISRAKLYHRKCYWSIRIEFGKRVYIADICTTFHGRKYVI